MQIQRRTPPFAPGFLLLAACTSPGAPAPPPGELSLPPELVHTTEHHFGSLLGGARATALSAEATGMAPQPVEVDVRFLFLEGRAEEELNSLAEHTRMVATPHADQPIRGASRFAVGAGFATDEGARERWAALAAGSAGRSRLAETYRGPLPVGISTTLSLETNELIEDPDNFLGEWPTRGPVQKRLAVGLEFDPQKGVALGLGFSNLGSGDRAPDAGPPPEGGRPDGKFLQHEWLVPSVTANVDGGPLLFVVPSPFESGEGRTCALWIEVRSHVPSDESDGAANAAWSQQIEQVLAAARAAGQSVRLAQEAPSSQNLELRNLRRTYTALHDTTDANRWRGLLLNLANTTRAPLAEDLAMIGDELTLRAWVDSLPALSDDVQLNIDQLGWRLERSVWRLLSKRAMNEGLPLGLEALCIRHAGEVGRYPSSFDQIALQCADRSAFQTRLINENQLFLEDSNVSARVRAFDWLARLELAPAGFDPLAGEDARRTALAAIGAAEQPPENN